MIAEYYPHLHSHTLPAGLSMQFPAVSLFINTVH